MKDDYSKAFEIFVGDGKGVLGLVAYALYKEEKRKQTLAIIESKRRYPNATEKKNIEEFCLNNKEHYQRKAKERLDELTSGVIAKNKEQIFESYFRETHDNLKSLSVIRNYLDITNREAMGILYKNTKPRSFMGEMKIEIFGNVFWILILFFLSFVAIETSEQVRGYKENLAAFFNGTYRVEQRDSIPQSVIKR